MPGYYDEISDLMSDATSPLDDPDEREEQGVTTLQQSGSSQEPAATQPSGRYSENGNELPEGLHSRLNKTDLPDRALPSPTQSIPSTVNATGSGSPPNVSPGGASAQDRLDSYADQGFQGELRNLSTGDKTVQEMAAQPSEDQVLQPLQDKLDAANTPVPRHQGAYDPSKPIGPGNQPGQENYRPSVGQRILRGVQGYARGGILGAVDPALVGAKPYGAPNEDYDREVERRQTAATSIGQRIKQQQDAYKARQTQLKDTAAAAQGQSTGYSRLPTGVAGQENARTAQVNARTAQQRADQNDPIVKAAAVADVDAAEFKRINDQNNDPKNPFSKLPQWAKLYRLGNKGKVPEMKPREGTAEESMYAKTYRSWEAQPENKGKMPTPQQIGELVAQSKGQETPTAKAAEKSTRDNLRIATTKLSSAAKALSAAQKKATTTFGKDRPAAQEEAKKAQQAFDEAQADLEGLGKDDAETPALVASVPAPTPSNFKPAPPAGATSEVYAKDGKTLIGHMVGKKYVKLGKK